MGQEAADLYRALAATRSEAFTPNLAGSLNTLANRLSELGRREEALAVGQEAADLYLALAVANRLSELGRREEALAAGQEAAALLTKK